MERVILWKGTGPNGATSSMDEYEGSYRGHYRDPISSFPAPGSLFLQPSILLASALWDDRIFNDLVRFWRSSSERFKLFADWKEPLRPVTGLLLRNLN